jgi:hypothetical protein
MNRYTARLLVEVPIRVYRFTHSTVRLFRRLLNGLSQKVPLTSLLVLVKASVFFQIGMVPQEHCGHPVLPS